jgi:hypothetical protein
MTWAHFVSDDTRRWLLEPADPAVQARALTALLDLPADHRDVARARRRAMRSHPIAPILAAQHPEGWWEKPGPGYSPKYTGTVWQLIILDQLGADPANSKVQRGCEYVLHWTATASGGFGASGAKSLRQPPASHVIHCLNGNLLHALIAFGHLEHPAVQLAIEWAARTISGEPGVTYYRSGTSGPGFECAANDHLPCAWGAVKELRALAAIPPEQRSPSVRRGLEVGVDFLFSRDPADADYPMGYGNTAPSSSWFRLGFPSGYVTDVLQNLEVLAALGYARDSRLDRAYEWLLSQQQRGRWQNRYAYNGKTTVDIERQGTDSKWVTLRACVALRARHG